MKSEVQVGISYLDSFVPNYIINDLQEEIEKINVKYEFRPEQIRIHASSEWAIPGIIAAYILQPYFESFLSEMGKDHYVAMKNWLKRLVRYGRNVQDQTIGSDANTPQAAKDSQSKGISINMFTNDHFDIKLLFDMELSDEDWERGIDSIMELLVKHYRQEDNLLSHFLDSQRLRGGTIFAILNRETKEWMFIGFDEFIQIKTPNK